MNIIQNNYTPFLFKNNINFSGYLKDIPVEDQEKILEQYANGDSYKTIKKKLSNIIRISESSIITFIRRHNSDDTLKQEHIKNRNRIKSAKRQQTEQATQLKAEDKKNKKAKIIEKTIQMVQEGNPTLYCIANACGVSVQTIFRYLHSNNDEGYQRYHEARLTYQTNWINNILEMYDMGISVENIAQELKCSNNTIEKYVHGDYKLDTMA